MHAPTITLNGSPVKLDETSFANAKDLVSAAMSAAADKGEVIANVVIDGRVMEDFDDSLILLALDNVTTVSIQTQHPDDAASSGIESFGDLAKFIVSRFTGACHDFRLGAVQDGFAKFMLGLDILQDGVRFMDLYLDYREMSQSNEHRTRFLQIHEGLKPILEEFEAAQKSEDWLHLADIIEHEFVPLVVELGFVGTSLHHESQLRGIQKH